MTEAETLAYAKRLIALGIPYDYSKSRHYAGTKTVYKVPEWLTEAGSRVDPINLQAPQGGDISAGLDRFNTDRGMGSGTMDIGQIPKFRGIFANGRP